MSLVNIKIKMATTTENKLFPTIEPFASGHLKVSELHSVYYEQCGKSNGMPVIFVWVQYSYCYNSSRLTDHLMTAIIFTFYCYRHGGPGGGTSANCRRYFDPEFYRIILIDQRGCGQSEPTAELKVNVHIDQSMYTCTYVWLYWF